jgi:hypothetical protein
MMKNLIITAAVLSSHVLFASSPSVVTAPIDHLFVPHGFDNNDNIELVVTGKYPNPCYSRNKIDVKVKGDLIDIHVTSLAKEVQNSSLCEDLKVPFSEVINVGSLQAGEYKIRVNSQTPYEQKGHLSVDLASSNSVDDFLYAQVDYVDLGFTGGQSGDALLVGRSLSPCLALDKVEYISNGKDTLSVLPIMKKISQDCPEKYTSLHVPIKFNLKNYKHEKVILFVRSVEGKSIHSFVSKE